MGIAVRHRKGLYLETMKKAVYNQRGPRGGQKTLFEIKAHSMTF